MLWFATMLFFIALFAAFMVLSGAASYLWVGMRFLFLIFMIIAVIFYLKTTYYLRPTH